MAKPKTIAVKNLSLDNALKTLTTLIEKMEHNETSLDETLEHFTYGMTLIRHAQDKLRDAEQKVEILLKENNQETLTDYEDPTP